MIRYDFLKELFSLQKCTILRQLFLNENAFFTILCQSPSL